MELSLKEHLFAENKTGESGTEFWRFEMTRTVTALYNSGGGVLRVGVEDNGTVSGVQKPQDYAADKSELVSALHHYLDLVPPIESVEKNGYIEIAVREGVLFPSILRMELEHPHSKRKYTPGTVFVRRMNGKQPSSEPPQTRSDWQKVLHLWETNRGVTIQGPLLAQFCLLVTKWNPFDEGITNATIWEANCIADTAANLGRDKLRDGLKGIIRQMQRSPRPPSSDETKDREGSDYKQPLHREIERLCHELGLSAKAESS